MSAILQSLHINQLLWHASHLPSDPNAFVASGYTQLDHKLNGGWPDKGIIELQSDGIGIGEIRLLFPALSQLCDKDMLYAWIAPPGRLNGQTLANAGLPLDKTLIATDVSAKESFWLAEKCLRSGCCAAVVLWCNELESTQARRLQLAAKEGNSLGFIIRPQSAVEQSLPVSIRMRATANQQGLNVNIDKRLGGNPVAPFTLNMHEKWPELTQPPAPSSSANNPANNTANNPANNNVVNFNHHINSRKKTA
ncbi:MAG: protein ImuA [Phenylobacterium sp.]|jgi:protein ImuA